MSGRLYCRPGSYVPGNTSCCCSLSYGESWVSANRQMLCLNPTTDVGDPGSAVFLPWVPLPQNPPPSLNGEASNPVHQMWLLVDSVGGDMIAETGSSGLQGVFTNESTDRPSCMLPSPFCLLLAENRRTAMSPRSWTRLRRPRVPCSACGRATSLPGCRRTSPDRSRYEYLQRAALQLSTSGVSSAPPCRSTRIANTHHTSRSCGCSCSRLDTGPAPRTRARLSPRKPSGSTDTARCFTRMAARAGFTTYCFRAMAGTPAVILNRPVAAHIPYRARAIRFFRSPFSTRSANSASVTGNARKSSAPSSSACDFPAAFWPE